VFLILSNSLSVSSEGAWSMTEWRLDGRRIMITAASSGLGLAMPKTMSYVMAGDLKPCEVTVNILPLGGATNTGNY